MQPTRLFRLKKSGTMYDKNTSISCCRSDLGGQRLNEEQLRGINSQQHLEGLGQQRHLLQPFFEGTSETPDLIL